MKTAYTPWLVGFSMILSAIQCCQEYSLNIIFLCNVTRRVLQALLGLYWLLSAFLFSSSQLGSHFVLGAVGKSADFAVIWEKLATRDLLALAVVSCVCAFSHFSSRQPCWEISAGNVAVFSLLYGNVFQTIVAWFPDDIVSFFRWWFLDDIVSLNFFTSPLGSHFAIDTVGKRVVITVPWDIYRQPWSNQAYCKWYGGKHPTFVILVL